MPAGRPRKDDTQGTKEQVEKRKYMRKYQAQIKKDIITLSKMEEDCDTELARIKKEKAMLINELEKANKQAENILKEATGAKPVNKEMNASSIINRAIKGKIARKVYKELK
jgi:tRNA U55 pseudouridine synthase TruB